ncbi:MAG: hypothetical protein WC734_06335 [Patescibacteria group bacterium]|jgi:hypothetical protein
MIALVDTHIIEQLQRVKREDISVTVYGPGAARPKGKMVPPCYAVSHYMPPQPDMTKTRPYLDDYEPSDKQAVVIYPKAFDENGDPIEITGPDSWTHRKWPIPHNLFYQIDLVATDQNEAYALYLGLVEALPIPYMFRIGSCAVKMIEAAKPANLNEVEKPLFRSSYSYKCSNVWTARSLSDTVPGIKIMDRRLMLSDPQ